jgi:phosphoglycolate phosphatase-like HAD superfamily hydrolase
MKVAAFDLDGTLVTAGPRQSWLLHAAARSQGVHLDVDAAWAAKREGASNKDYLRRLGLDDAVAVRINALWMSQVETPYWLQMDTVLNGVIDTLDGLKQQGWQCILVTARANPWLMRQQIATLGLARRFDGVYCVSPVRAAHEKADVLRETGAAFFVGDAESDAAAAAAAGVSFAGVTTGQRSGACLARHGVRHLFDVLADGVSAGVAGRLD